MIKYRLVPKKDMSKGALKDAKLYYPQLVSNGRVTFETICEEVAEQSSLTSGDIKNCMDRIIHVATAHLREGRSVDLGDLGGFGIYLRSSGADTPDSYNAEAMMREPTIRYYPGKKLRNMRKVDVKFERIKPENEKEVDDRPVVE